MLKVDKRVSQITEDENWSLREIRLCVVNAPSKSIMPFGRKGKLNPQYMGPFEILDGVGTVAYRITLSSNLSLIHNVFHILMLHKYDSDLSMFWIMSQLNREKV